MSQSIWLARLALATIVTSGTACGRVDLYPVTRAESVTNGGDGGGGGSSGSNGSSSGNGSSGGGARPESLPRALRTESAQATPSGRWSWAA